MDEKRGAMGPQFRADRPAEREAVRLTIVGGRPPGGGKDLGRVPRGIEVLMKKAAVDPQFRSRLLETRAEAAAEIGLELSDAESRMLRALPQAQLEAAIERTAVPEEHRRVFLGKVAAAMLAAIGAGGADLALGMGVRGIRPDSPGPPEAVRLTDAERKICEVIAEQTGHDVAESFQSATLAGLQMDERRRDELRKALQAAFDVELPAETFDAIGVLPQLHNYIRVSHAVIEAVGEVAPTARADDAAIARGTRLEADLGLKTQDYQRTRQKLALRFRVTLETKPFRETTTVGEMVDYVAEVVEQRRLEMLKKLEEMRPPVEQPRPVRGTRPDRPPGGSFGNRP